MQKQIIKTPDFRAFGSNGLVPRSIFVGKKALKDAGAHGMVYAGVHWDKLDGARSIVFGDVGYDDVHTKGQLLYEGAGSRTNAVLTRSVETGKPIRVFSKIGNGRGGVGLYLYEGLYTAEGMCDKESANGKIKITYTLIRS